ncbi:uncharacterized protein LOC130702529 [Daphnia carinata]|uniref:uncharacterized protein LOC130702529 n=1 Tax=Daphnia carinata TaxID=120202 RepID=UPI00257E8645|nr:uncharacterized protein LOC130702529 [Daphnia carinata]
MLAIKHLVRHTAQLKRCTNLVTLDRFRPKNRNTTFSRPLYRILNFSLASGFVVTFNDDNEEEEVKTKINIAEPKSFSNTFKLQQAGNEAVNSSMSVLSTAFHTFHFAHQEYIMLLGSAISALLTAIEVGPVMVERLGIEEHLSQLQAEIFLQKKQISDSLYVYNESIKLLNVAANISFLAGNEILSGLASTHLHNVQQEVDKMRSEAIKLEQEYLELQMQFIVKSQPT